MIWVCRAGINSVYLDDFLRDKYSALFKLGFEPELKGESPSLRFLRSIAMAFVNDLTSQPDLEVAREWTKVELLACLTALFGVM